MTHIHQIKELHAKQQACWAKKEELNNIIRSVRKELTDLISPYYWNLTYKAKDLELMFGIPATHMHLYAEEKKITKFCTICKKSMRVIVKSRSEMDKTGTCSYSCHHKECDRIANRFEAEWCGE